MLEKNRQKKRAIGTLDVAFKKRFFALSGAGQDPAVEGKTPRKFLEIFYVHSTFIGTIVQKNQRYKDNKVIIYLPFFEPETPILGGNMGKMPMRRETLKALEQRRDHVVSERKQSKMLTLGASNNMNNNKDKHRSAAKITGDTVDKIFAVAHSGVDNIAFGKFLLCVYCFVFLFLFTIVSLHFFSERGNGSSNTDDEASSRNSVGRQVNPSGNKVNKKS